MEINRKDETLSDSCIIEIVDDQKTPIIEIEDIESHFVNPSSGTIIHATVYQLRTFCTMQWKSMVKPGFEVLDMNEIVSLFERLHHFYL